MTDDGAGAGRRERRKHLADCRRDRHRYGVAKPVGGGIARRTCVACGAVSIDLTSTEDFAGLTLFHERVELPENLRT